MNAIMKLRPYWKYNTWCFTDELAGLKDEAFVAGADQMITHLVKKKEIVNPEEGFILTFSETYFPEADTMITHQQPDEHSTGNWYLLEDGDIKIFGWLCPALFKYFSVAPKQMYVKVESLNLEQ